MGCKDININAVPPIDDDLDCGSLIPDSFPVEDRCDEFDTQLVDLQSRFDVCPKYLTVEDFQKLITYLKGFVEQSCYNDKVFLELVKGITEALKCHDTAIINLREDMHKIYEILVEIKERIEDCCSRTPVCVSPVVTMLDLHYDHEGDEVVPPLYDKRFDVLAQVSSSNDNLSRIVSDALGSNGTVLCILEDGNGVPVQMYVQIPSPDPVGEGENDDPKGSAIVLGRHGSDVRFYCTPRSFPTMGTYTVRTYYADKCSRGEEISIPDTVIDDLNNGDKSSLLALGLVEIASKSFEVIKTTITISFTHAITDYPVLNFPTNQEINKFDIFTLPTNIPTTSGLRFGYWISPSNTQYLAGDVYYGKTDVDVEFRAGWYIESYNFAYNLDGGTGGSGGTAPGVKQYMSDIIVMTTPPTKAGYVFSGWRRSDNAQTVNTGATIQMPPNDLTLTAIWTNAPKYPVTYDPAGGSTAPVDPNSPYLEGATVTILNYN